MILLQLVTLLHHSFQAHTIQTAASLTAELRAEAAEGALDGRLDAINLSAVTDAEGDTTGEL